MIPLYGFLEGDTIGLLLLAYPHETIAQIADKLQKAARIRVTCRTNVKVIYKTQILDPKATVQEAGLQALERLDVVGD